MKIGDLVRAKYDIERGLHCVGIVTDINNRDNFNIKVHWLSDVLPPLDTYGWWKEEKLKKI